MGYRRAEDVLPAEVLALVQEYAAGELLYIPRREKERYTWGSVSGARESLARRNARIRADARAGSSTRELGTKYYLSEKSIQRILRGVAPSETQEEPR